MTYTWSADKPTRPGWYWWKFVMWGKIFEKIVQVEDYNGKLYVVGFGPGLDWIGEWAGPIEEPQEGNV